MTAQEPTTEENERLAYLERVFRERGRRVESKPERISKFREDPLGFTMWDLPWGLPGELEHFQGPDNWQKEFLAELGEEIRKRKFDGHTPVAPIRMTRSAGKGIGKSALVGMLCNYLVKCWPNCQGTVTANTYVQLETRTWAMIEKWFRLSRSSDNFRVTGSGIQHKGVGKAWACFPKTCSPENSVAFAGQHAADSVQFYIFDESSNIEDIIWETAMSGMVDGMPMIFAFGNPTRSSGKFFKINFGDERDYWNHKAIDARDCMIPNKQTLAEDVEREGGEDSDYVRVYIRGINPNAGDMQYIDNARVYAAQKRIPEILANEPLIAGVDLARGGGDKAIVRFRRGDDARSIPPLKFTPDETRDSMRLVAKLTDLATRTFNGKRVDVWFLDGGGVGGPIIDRMLQLGHSNFIEIQFGSECPDKRHFANMRIWMWNKMRDHLGTRLAIDKDKDLEADLTGVGLAKSDNTDRKCLESKEHMKKRGLHSPDDGDALALTYAQPVAPVSAPSPPRNARIRSAPPSSNGWMGG